MTFPFLSNLAAQAVLPQKDLAFGQVATGDTIETLLTVTNRGTTFYEGTIFLRRNNDGDLWTPMVNGEMAEGGEVAVLISPGDTQTFRITDSATQPGTAIIFSSNVFQDNFLEGNLTFLIRSGGQIVDSVGVLPSQEFYRASVPFEDFREVGLALSNGDFIDNEAANVTVRLFDATGVGLGTSNVMLEAGGHMAQFLFELFDDVDLETGRVDIETDVPVYGTALTLIRNELSTLPLLPFPTAYDLQLMNAGGGVIATAGVSLWAEGFFVRGYMVVSTENGNPVQNEQIVIMNGRLIDGALMLTFFANGPGFGEDVSLYMEADSFSFGQETINGTWVRTALDDNAVQTGTFQLTRRVD